jgi:hypothetical protein
MVLPASSRDWPLQTKVAISCGTAGNTHQRTQSNIPEGVNTQWNRCENLKSCIYALFNDLTNSSENEASNGLWSVDNKLVRIWKEVGLCLLQTLPWHMLLGCWENAWKTSVTISDVPVEFRTIRLPNTRPGPCRLSHVPRLSASSIHFRVQADPQFLQCDCTTLKLLLFIIFPHSTLTDCRLEPRRSVFTALYELSVSIQFRSNSIFKGIICVLCYRVGNTLW